MRNQTLNIFFFFMRWEQRGKNKRKESEKFSYLNVEKVRVKELKVYK